MKKFYLSIAALMLTTLTAWGQNPGLLISEFYQNPGGTDSPFEYLELLATDEIDFTVTPYTVIVSNNGTATTDGWVEGNFTTYAFEITTGSVSVGDVVYVGGTSMAPTGTKLREINTGTTGGDGGIGNASGGGVFGNGGGNGDGIAVFDLPVASVTPTSVPVDAIFYGSGTGGAVVGPGEGYEMPVNDHYDGGKLEGGDFVAIDEDLTVATGTFDLGTETFTVARTFTDGGAGTDGVSAIELLEATPPSFSFLLEDLTVLEEDGEIEVSLELNNSNGAPSTGDIVIFAGASSANSPADFILLDTTITFDGDMDEVLTFSIEILDDELEEQSEYISITMDNLDNAELDGNEEMFVYITDNDRVPPTATNELKLELLTSFSNGVEELSSAEIVVFDTTFNYLFVANSIANQIDIIDFNIPESPVLLDSIEFDSVGFINSVAIHGGVLAVAVQAPIAQDPGFISFWNTDGTWLNRLTVGALPDMVAFNHAGDQLVVACEGEPNDDYTVDPEGMISIISLDDDIAALTGADVTNLDFNAFDGTEAELAAEGARIFGPGATVSQDLEPEYVTINADDATAVVTLQENNAIAIVDLVGMEIVDIIGLGNIDHSLPGNGLDASNRTDDINIANFPILGMFQPDAIDNMEVGGAVYYFTANEGDARDYDGYSEEERVDDLLLDETVYPDADFWQHDHLLGRLKTTSATGDLDDDGDIDQIYSYGTRSFSIWNEAGELVFDSGDMIEQIIANDPDFVDIFNAHNEGGEAEQKNRSDDKGPEPEGVVATMIQGNAYLFVSLERVGGAMVFNINDPETPVYIGYYNNRDAETNGPDRGAEGMIYVDAENSPNENGLLILANEVSSSLTIYQVNTCAEVTDFELAAADDATAFCAGESLELMAEGDGTFSYQWWMDESVIDGATEETFMADMAGDYQVSFFNEEEACEGVSELLSIEVNELPDVLASASADSICFDTEVTLMGDGAEMYEWALGIEDGVAFTPAVTGPKMYYVTGTDANGCMNEDSVEVTMAEAITIDVTKTDELIGSDGDIDISVAGGFGLYTFDWDNDETGEFDDTEDLEDLVAGTYVVVVEDEFGCSTSETVVINSQVGLTEDQVQLAVYPNPANDFITIQMMDAFDYTIFNMNGQAVANGVGNDQEQVNVSDLTNGVYLLQVQSETVGVKTIKLIVK